MKQCSYVDEHGVRCYKQFVVLFKPGKQNQKFCSEHKKLRCKEVKRKYYLKNGKENKRKYYLKNFKDNPEKLKQHSNYKYKRAYNISVFTKDLAVSLLNNKCQLCGKDDKLHVDHDHETGLVRGFICRNCNMALGKLGDTKEGLQKAIDYLNREPGQFILTMLPKEI
jgi:hypothetical protein